MSAKLARTLTLAMAVALSASLSAACAPSEVRVTARAEPARLVLIAPGIWVVENYPYSVFYVDGSYWTYRDGSWYRSDWYADGFMRVEVALVPAAVIHIRQPRTYARYRAPRGTRVRVIDHRRRTVPVRDHRTRRR